MRKQTQAQTSEPRRKSKFSLKKILFQTLLSQYKRFKLKHVDLSPENSQATIRILLDKARYLFVVTQSLDPAQGRQFDENAEYREKSGIVAQNSSRLSNVRYVQPIIEWQDQLFSIWIGTLANSRKIAEIKRNPNVTLALGNDSAGANLIIHGKASLHTDLQLKQRYWKPEWRLFFPEGPQDADYIVVKIEPQHLELMDLRHGITPEPFGLKQLHLVQSDKGNGAWQAIVQ